MKTVHVLLKSFIEVEKFFWFAYGDIGYIRIKDTDKVWRKYITRDNIKYNLTDAPFIYEDDKDLISKLFPIWFLEMYLMREKDKLKQKILCYSEDRIKERLEKLSFVPYVLDRIDEYMRRNLKNDSNLSVISFFRSYDHYEGFELSYFEYMHLLDLK